ncbi:MAG TPA: hypothetical protein VJJ76_02590 [archaeon]|nr:hypothetical protein [archaeon]
MARPLGITIICVLGWLSALIAILGGLALFGITTGLGTVIGGVPGGVLAGLGSVAGLLIFVLGIATAYVLYGLWQMKKWGWTWTMVLEGISLLIALPSFNIVGIAIPAIIIFYLWTNQKRFK